MIQSVFFPAMSPAEQSQRLLLADETGRQTPLSASLF